MKLTIFSILTVLSSAAVAAPIDEARSAYSSFDVAKAKSVFARIVETPEADAKDKGSAQVELARIEWLVDGHTEAALARLARSLPLNPEPCGGAYLYARILNDAHRFVDVRALLEPYAGRCAALERGIAIEQVRSNILLAASLPAAKRSAPLRRARAGLAQLEPITRAYLEADRLAMDLAILERNGSRALAAWRSYFWLSETNRPTGFKATSAEIEHAFKRGVLAGADERSALSLVEILIRAGFANEAYWLIDGRGRGQSKDPRWRVIRAYRTMRTELISATLQHDRAYARTQKEGEGSFQKRVLDLLRDGIRAAGEADVKEPWPALERLWGLHGQTGNINGVSGLLLGHAVEEQHMSIAQGKRKGELRFILLDNMIENSFSAWLWDDGSGPGGWASAGKTIYQVRPGYALGTLRILSRTFPGPARERALARMQRLDLADRNRLRGDVPVPLEGVASRLEFQAAEELAAKLRAQAADRNKYMQSFRRAWWDATINSSIVLHEGRHALDQSEYRGSQELAAPELEYRAKISEVGYSRMPRLALSPILSVDLPADSSHGQANRRIIALYRDWISAHQREITNFDPASPGMLQIDKLSDDQLREVVLQADPEHPNLTACPPPSLQGRASRKAT